MQMVTFIKESGLRIRNKAKENIIIVWQMIHLMEIGLEIKSMGKEYTHLGIILILNLEMEMFMKENGVKINGMVRGSIHQKIEHICMENLGIINLLLRWTDAFIIVYILIILILYYLVLLRNLPLLHLQMSYPLHFISLPYKNSRHCKLMLVLFQIIIIFLLKRFWLTQLLKNQQ